MLSALTFQWSKFGGWWSCREGGFLEGLDLSDHLFHSMADFSGLSVITDGICGLFGQIDSAIDFAQQKQIAI